SERVAIPRERNDENQSKPFYMERIYFTNGGLYFLVSGDELNKLEAALNFLQYEGFGTDRNVGNGFFKWHRKEISLNVPTGSAYSACLGLYCPTDKTKVQLEVNDKSSYELVKRGGWITTPGYQTIEKNSIYMFTEGSIFYKKDHIDGKGNIDLTPATLPIEMKPSHPIYRCGRTLFIPVKLLHYE
ncbi:MAG: hypothetical protein ABI844_00880, partial [Saprospiraceae bacterium]